jgi:hypothetical protein
VPSEIIGIGAIVGAGLAAWFRRSTRWLLQIVAGAWIGFAAGGWLRDYLEWPLTSDYDLLAGTIAGLLGYSFLQMALSPDVWKAVKARFGLVNDPQAPN